MEQPLPQCWSTNSVLRAFFPRVAIGCRLSLQIDLNLSPSLEGGLSVATWYDSAWIGGMASGWIFIHTCICGCLPAAIGCADVSAPAGGWVRRDADYMSVGCDGVQRSWHLTCNGTNWIGEFGNCDDITGSSSCMCRLHITLSFCLFRYHALNDRQASS